MKADVSEARAVGTRFDGRLSALHLPTSDLLVSRDFYVDVLGGDLAASDAHSVRVRFANLDIVAHLQNPGGATPKGREYPHYAFGVTAEQFVGIKRRLDAFKIPTGEPWVRSGEPFVLMYFRDPVGNQYELFSEESLGERYPVRVGARFGGDYVIDFDALTYDRFERPTDADAAPPTRPQGFNHLTMPVRDLVLGKRFLVDALDGEVVLDIPNVHVTAMVAGADIGIAPAPEGFTPRLARFPHLEFTVSRDVLLAMRDRLRALNVHASPIASETATDVVLFFRDPSGNLWKLRCADPSGELSAAAIAESAVDVEALNYEWVPG